MGGVGRDDPNSAARGQAPTGSTLVDAVRSFLLRPTLGA
jgi:hypothetical protein